MLRAAGILRCPAELVLVGPVHLVAGHPVANLAAYRVAFLVAAAVALCGMACSLSIRDADAASTVPARRGRPDLEPAAEPRARRESPSICISSQAHRPTTVTWAGCSTVNR